MTVADVADLFVENRVSVVSSDGRSGEKAMLFCTKCLIWRYLQKYDFVRSNFSESSANDPNLSRIKRREMKVRPN